MMYEMASREIWGIKLQLLDRYGRNGPGLAGSSRPLWGDQYNYDL